jgi:hypothetical protein
MAPCTQASSAPVSGTTSVSRPACAASSAVKGAPVSVARARKRRPTTRWAGTRMRAGATPTRTSLKAKVLAEAATAMSAAARRPSPPARACPLTRTMTGAGDDVMAVRISGMREAPVRSRSFRSAPEQKTLPVPVTTMARTTRSVVASRNPSASSASRREESAFRLCGESSVSVHTAPSRSTWTS